jgi:hypothetical protein
MELLSGPTIKNLNGETAKQAEKKQAEPKWKRNAPFLNRITKPEESLARSAIIRC